MKNVQDTPEYLAARSLEVYRATLEGVAESGVITNNDRKVLDHLREKLVISQSDALDVEKALNQ